MAQGVEVYQMTQRAARQDRPEADRFSRDAARQLSGFRKPAAKEQHSQPCSKSRSIRIACCRTATPRYRTMSPAGRCRCRWASITTPSWQIRDLDKDRATSEACREHQSGPRGAGPSTRHGAVSRKITISAQDRSRGSGFTKASPARWTRAGRALCSIRFRSRISSVIGHTMFAAGKSAVRRRSSCRPMSENAIVNGLVSRTISGRICRRHRRSGRRESEEICRERRQADLL